MLKKSSKAEYQLPSNKKFGLFFALIFFLLALYLNQNFSDVLTFFTLAVSILFLVAALFFDANLTFLNKLWMKLGIFMSKVVNPLVMGIIFFTLFVPIGLIMRIFGRDELRLKMKLRDSHWKIREHNDSNIDSYKNQF